jgi:hypothetical protein
VHRNRRDLGVLFAALAALAATACVGEKDPSVGMTRVEANLVFGVVDREPAAPPSQAIATAVADELPAFAELSLDEFRLPGGAPLPSFTTPSECPTAPPTASVEVPTDVNITGEPLVGVARWKRDGHVIEGDQQITVSGFERRVVRNFRRVDDDTTAFETLQPAGGRLVVSQFEVNTAAFSRNPTSGVGTVGTPSVGEPERGVVLTQVEYLDRSGNSVASAFRPAVGVLMLPLPVSAGDTWESVAVDPRSGTTVVHEGTVLRRTRIDACGELADGWLVEATQATSGGPEGDPPQQINYHYVVATQFGGMLVNERLVSEGVFDLNFTLGQLKPDPIPTS